MFTSVSPSHCLNMSSRILPISCLVFVFVRYYDLVYSTHFVWQGRIDAPGSSPPPPGGPDLETNINRGRSSLFWSHLAGVQVHGTAWSPCYPDLLSVGRSPSLLLCRNAILTKILFLSAGCSPYFPSPFRRSLLPCQRFPGRVTPSSRNDLQRQSRSLQPLFWKCHFRRHS